ncbi:MAG: hypothetical protein LBK70_01180 [Clostridiales bacterium]|nr:hypothetical protein [Clostridiales bacterium]
MNKTLLLKRSGLIGGLTILLILCIGFISLAIVARNSKIEFMVQMHNKLNPNDVSQDQLMSLSGDILDWSFEDQKLVLYRDNLVHHTVDNPDSTDYYQFVGWSLSNTPGAIYYGDWHIIVDKDIEIYAIFRER